ncbi:MAG: amidohydrolase [Fusobacteriaceae bacterium]
MGKEELKLKVIEAIDKNKDLIIKVGRAIYSEPELGYKEFKTTEKICNFLKDLNLSVESNIAVTGCKSIIDSGKQGPNICIMGELDSVTCADHCDSKDGGTIHACGHNVQVGGMLGAALGLVKSGVMKNLVGKVTILGTPAEEYIELEYRSLLREQGKLKYFGGKQELIYKGYLDDIDISMMFHSMDLGGKSALLGPTSNGFLGKNIKYIGKQAHAGSAPHEGINALNAAMLSINNIHAQRETFKDTDRVRVHPIITKGGDIVNSVPSEVKMESYVRAASVEGMLDSNYKVDRAIKAGAMAVGAKVEIKSIPGYLPLLKNSELDNIFKSNLENIGISSEKIIEGGDYTCSFDFGDVSHLMPSIHPLIGGITGNLHAIEFKIEDEELAYIVPAKAMALSVVDLLFEDASLAKEILSDFTPKMTKKEYLNFLEEMECVEVFEG